MYDTQMNASPDEHRFRRKISTFHNLEILCASQSSDGLTRHTTIHTYDGYRTKIIYTLDDLKTIVNIKTADEH